MISGQHTFLCVDIQHQRALMVDIFDRRAHHILHLIGTENAVFGLGLLLGIANLRKTLLFIMRLPQTNSSVCYRSDVPLPAAPFGEPAFLVGLLLDFGAGFPE